MAARKQAPRRRDPESRPVVYQPQENSRIVNGDPNKRYVLAYMNDPASGVESYRARGYEVELWREDGPRFEGMLYSQKNEGQPMEWMGNVLVSIDAELARDRWETGGPDGPGQTWGDLMEAKLVRNKGFPDPMRGIGRGIRQEIPTDSEVESILKQRRVAPDGAILDG